MTSISKHKPKIRRSVLITPCDDAWDIMVKSATTIADVIRLELEDGVLPDRKAHARQCCVQAIREIDWGDKEVWVRICHLDDGYAEADIDALVQAGADVILMGKTQGVHDIQRFDALVTDAETRHAVPPGSVKIGCGIERVRALARVEDIAEASPRMTVITPGLDDLSNEYGYRLTREPADALETLYARSRIVLAARVAGISCIDYPFLKHRDEESSAADARFSARLGFDGKYAISPRQLAGIHKAFAATEKEIAWATAIMQTVNKSDSPEAAVYVVGDSMVDAPHIIQARRILERAQAAES